MLPRKIPTLDTRKILAFVAPLIPLLFATASLHVVLHAEKYFAAGATIAKFGTLGLNIVIFALTLFVASRYRGNDGGYIRKYLGVALFFQVGMLFLLPQFVYPQITGAPWWLANPYFSTFLVIVFPWLGPFMLIGAGGFLFWYGIFYFLLITSLVFFFGRRVYCSWICQRGLLSETFGDFWRQATPRGTLSRIFEYLPFVIMLVVFFLGISAVLHIFFNFGYDALISTPLKNLNWKMAQFANLYDIFFYTVIYQIVTLALYPLWGGRIFCRFFCPVGNFFGIISKFGRYRVRGKGYCIHCHECTKNCAMGIEVEQAVATGNLESKDIQCVGCGICEYVCPVNNIELTCKSKPCPRKK
jgi:polyferredoxin